MILTALTIFTLPKSTVVKRYLLFIGVSLSISSMFSQNLSTCAEEWCYDKEGNVIESLRFDPATIKWPLHFTGETVKNEDWIHIKYEHHNQVDITSLRKYRNIIDDQEYCEDGVALYDPFSCEYGYSGKPSFIKASCSLVGVSHKEREIKLGVGSCFKKIIDWTIIDWCTYDPKEDNSPDNDDLFLVKDLVNGYSYYSYNSEYGRLDKDGAYHYQQIIKVGDVEQPEIIHSEEMHLEVGNECKIQVITLGNRAVDAGVCPSENFTWTVSLYQEGEKSEILEYTTIEEDSVEVNLENLTPGEYKILWRVKDGCNNLQEVRQIINVDDYKAPSIICKGSFSVGVGSPGEPITIWAKDFVKSVSDNCSSPEDILFSFDKDSITSTLDLTCESHLGEAEIPIYATDREGNQSYCLVKSKFSSSDPNCKRNISASGQLLDQNGNALANKSLLFQISVYGNKVIHTDGYGMFSIDQDIPLISEASISLNSEVISGKISTFDLVAIQKHVMKAEMISDMYKYAAADINGDGEVSSEDVKMLRGYLLGITRFEDVLGNKLIDLDSGLSARTIKLTEDMSALRLSIVVTGDVVE